MLVHVVVTSVTEYILLITSSGHHVGPPGSKTWVLGIVRHQVILQSKVGIHTDDGHVKKSNALVSYQNQT